MAIRKKPERQGSAASMDKAYAEFFCIINGEDVQMGKPSFDGFDVVSQPRDITASDYRPESKIEKALSKLGLGHNSSDDVFTVQKDDYQALVFEHAGQYFLSDWFYDMRSRKLEMMMNPFLKSESMEGLLSLANWVGREDAGFPEDDRVLAQDLVNIVSDVPRDVPEVDESVVNDSIRKTLLNGFLDNMSEEGLQRLEARSMEQRESDFRWDCHEIILQGYSFANPTREVIGGESAKDFAGTAHWSRALDFELPAIPDFKGLRFIDFKDCTNVHVLRKDGESIPVDELSKESLRAVCKKLEKMGAQKVSVAKRRYNPLGF